MRDRPVDVVSNGGDRPVAFEIGVAELLAAVLVEFRRNGAAAVGIGLLFVPLYFVDVVTVRLASEVGYYPASRMLAAVSFIAEHSDWVTGAWIEGAICLMVDRSVRPPTSLGRAGRRIVPLFLAYLVACSMIIPGCLAFVVPGVYTAGCFGMVSTLVVSREEGILASFPRSFEISRGNRLAIGFAHLIVFVSTSVFAAVVVTLLSVVGFDFDVLPTGRMSDDFGFRMWAAIGMALPIPSFIGPTYLGLYEAAGRVDVSEVARTFE